MQSSYIFDFSVFDFTLSVLLFSREKDLGFGTFSIQTFERLRLQITPPSQL